MPVQKTITLYQFDELPSEKAKAAARDWYREALDASDMQPTIEDFITIAGLLGITFREQRTRTVSGRELSEPMISWELHVQGAGASFDGSWLYASNAVVKIREYAPQDAELHRIADALSQYPGYSATCNTGRHSCAAHSAAIVVYDPEDNEIYEDDSAAAKAIDEALCDLMTWLYEAIDREWDHQSSDETIEENIRANEYYFTDTGKRCNP